MKDKAKKTRREKGEGHLYKRKVDGKTVPADDTRPGTYWIRYSLNGKRVRESLGTKDKRKAIKEAAKRLAPMQAADQAERARILATRAEATKTAAEELEDQSTPTLKLEGAWQVYIEHQDPCGPRGVAQSFS